MQVKDAGPEVEKISRARWAGKLLQAILDRLDMKETRITVVAFYTKAIPVLQDTTDKNVVSNMMDGLPMHVAFDAGATDVNAGVELALKLAKPWARRSATLVVITDRNESWHVGVEHGALHHSRSGALDVTPEATLSLPHLAFAALAGGNQTLEDVEKSGETQVQGDRTAVEHLLKNLDKFRFGFPIVTP